MESLLTGMLSKMGDQGIGKIAESAGINPDMAKIILKQAGPLLTAKMADNTKTEEGLSSLNSALEKHDGSIFGHLEDVVSPDVDTKGNKILGHILGDNLGSVVGALSSKNGADAGSTGKLLEMAAPLILGQLGSQKKESGLDAAGLFDLLQGEKKQVQESSDNMLLDLAKNFIDQDNDGSIVDDVLGMAGSFFKK